MARARADKGSVGLVLAGGGARGAYEIGALSVLLAELDRRGERPVVVVGTSVGALNAAFLAATAHLPVAEAVPQALEIWRCIRFGEAAKSIFSLGTLGRLARYAGQFLGVPRARLWSLLDSSPLRATLEQKIAFDQIERNVHDGALHAAATIATSAATSRSVVFHCGGTPPNPRDKQRGIDYAQTPLGVEHVLASAAIPGVFPAVHVSDPDGAAGWYFDGGTRLNTPIKPALKLGAERVVVIALNPIAPPPQRLAGERRPDALEGAGQIAQGLLVDPLVHDVQTLAKINSIASASVAGPSEIPYIVVAPEHDAIGALAREAFRGAYMRLRAVLRAPDLVFLGHAVAADSNALHGELLSYLFFASDFADALIELGRADAERWLQTPHADGIWEI